VAEHSILVWSDYI